MVQTNSQIIEQKLKALSNVIGEGRSISRDLFAAEGATVRNSNRTSLKLDRTAGEVVAYTRGGMERGRIDAVTFVGMEQGLRSLPGMAKRTDVFRALSERIKAAAPKKPKSANAKRGPLSMPERNQIVAKAREEGLTIAQRFRANRGAVLTNPKNGQSLRFDEASGRIIRTNKAGEVMDSVSPSRLHALELAGRERRLIDEAFGGRIRRKADGWLNHRADIIQKQETARRGLQIQNERLAFQKQARTQRALPTATVMRTLAALDYDPKAAPSTTTEPRPTAVQGSPPKKLNLRKLADQSAARVAERPEQPEAQRPALAL